MKTSRFILAAVVLAAASVGASAADLVTNGGFEDYAGNPVNGYSVVGAGSSSLTGWTVGGVSVDVINGNYGAITGNSIDMLGSPGPGSLSQMLGTVSGQTYTLTFDLSANGSGGAPDKSLEVSFSNGATASFIGSTSLAHESYQFTANSNQTLLTFAANTGGNAGPVLDNVSVAAVPEPESYAMMLAGLGLMGFVAKRRKAKQA